MSGLYNVIHIDAFSKLFDGFSIGSNDHTQLTIGIGRDSELVAFDYDERDAGVKEMIRLAVEGCRRNRRHSDLCGIARTASSTRAACSDNDSTCGGSSPSRPRRRRSSSVNAVPRLVKASHGHRAPIRGGLRSPKLIISSCIKSNSGVKLTRLTT